MARSTTKKPKSALANVVELVVTVVVAVGLALLIQAFIVKPYKIPSGSMIPTLDVGQRVLANRLDTSPSLGDVVVFHPPIGADAEHCTDPRQGNGSRQACDTAGREDTTQTYIKRVVGLPGDHISIVSGHVIRNGRMENAPYAEPCTATINCTFPHTFTVPPGQYFMMGDNRGESDDSRFWGPVRHSWIIGVAFFTYWPVGRIGTL
ncbi:MAG TPA: signal peptidase I [Solirubrobacteraceae bacterium]|jgi:signal peptidase I|nr:signal peptidase I [Solirubrobacteraceae bacterium]